MVWESVGFVLPCGSNVAGLAAGSAALDFAGAVALEDLAVESDLVGALDADLLPALLLVTPPVVGVDGVVFFPSSPDGVVILTQQLPDGMH